MDAAAWDARYAARDLPWGAPPNPYVVEHATALPRGRALDLACGYGRNTLWLATRGWEVTALDYSGVAVARGEEIAAAAPAAVRRRITWAVADVTTADLGEGHDLVLWSFLHLPAAQRDPLLRRAAAALAPGGRLLLVAHDATNPEHGWGGARDPDVLPTPEAVVAALGGALVVDRAEVARRPVDTDEGPRVALDTLVLAHRAA